jgi:hypothetical protein
MPENSVVGMVGFLLGHARTIESAIAAKQAQSKEMFLSTLRITRARKIPGSPLQSRRG